jgi:hypothetical protein
MSEDLGTSLQRYIEARYAAEEAWRLAQEAQERYRVAERSEPGSAPAELSAHAAARADLWAEYNQHLREAEREFLDTAWRVATAGAASK